MKTTCEPRETDLQELLSLADSCVNSIEKLVLDGGKIPEVRLRSHPFGCHAMLLETCCVTSHDSLLQLGLA